MSEKPRTWPYTLLVDARGKTANVRRCPGPELINAERVLASILGSEGEVK